MIEEYETKNEKGELLEPFFPKEKNFIYGVNQNHFEYTNPNFVYPLDEKGFGIKRKLPSVEKIVTHYWAKKQKKIALLGAISCLIPFSILVQTTGIFDTIFITTVNFILGSFWAAVGVFIP